jgi:hypothetical protein
VRSREGCFNPLEPNDATLCRRVIGSIPDRSIICVGQLWPFFSKPVGYFVLAFAVLIRLYKENLNLGLS